MKILKETNSITLLDLSLNFIQINEISSILAPSVQSFALRSNRKSVKGIENIKLSSNFIFLDLGFNNLSKEDKKKILSAHTHLKKLKIN